MSSTISERLRQSRKNKGFSSARAAARFYGWTESTYNSHEVGMRGFSLDSVETYARAYGVSPAWLLYGEKGGPDLLPANIIEIPKFSIFLSKDHAAWDPKHLTPIEYIPFSMNFLKNLLKRSGSDNLVVIEVDEDSMSPTINKSDLVLIDMRDKTLHSGVYAFILNGFIQVNRVRQAVGGVEIISDNRELYRPFILTPSEMQNCQIIGRVRWISRSI